jgi:hypothetical protein
MGCGHTSQRDKIISPHHIGKVNMRYPNHMRLRIRTRDTQGKEGFRTVPFALKTPFLHKTPKSLFPPIEFVSLCTLPGIDPTGTTEKKCQDICGVYSNPSAILLVLFDGHGKDGEKIVDICLNETAHLFEETFQEYIGNEKAFLERICKTCDDSVKRNPSVDSNNSGR